MDCSSFKMAFWLSLNESMVFFRSSAVIVWDHASEAEPRATANRTAIRFIVCPSEVEIVMSRLRKILNNHAHRTLAGEPNVKAKPDGSKSDGPGNDRASPPSHTAPPL